jgi:hypothetical protein
MSAKNILPTEGFVRDSSGALVCVDNKALDAYKKRRELELNKQNEINNMKNELFEIKVLLTQLLEKNNK